MSVGPRPGPAGRYPCRVPDPSELEARVAALEVRIEEVAADAAAARHLAAARDRDLADLTVKADAHRSAINALGEQTAARFDRLEGRLDRFETEVRAGFAGMRGALDGVAAGQSRIVELLDGIVGGEADR